MDPLTYKKTIRTVSGDVDVVHNGGDSRLLGWVATLTCAWLRVSPPVCG